MACADRGVETPYEGRWPGFRVFLPALLLFGVLAAAVLVGVTPARDSDQAATLVASIRSAPRSLNRYTSRDFSSTVVALLTHSALVRINRVSDELEPELAESWELLPDHRTYRLRLRHGIYFSDGAPFSSDDVVFSFRAIYDPRTASPLVDSLQVRGQPLEVWREDLTTVCIRFPETFGPGLRILDGIPILPRHRLSAALEAGRFAGMWGAAVDPSELAGLGPFVLRRHIPGQRLEFERNSRYWRRAGKQPLPKVDRLVLQIVADQDSESLQLQTGAIDFTQSELRPADIGSLRKAVDDGRIMISDLGVARDGDLFWFNLTADKQKDRRSRWLQHVDFRRAVSQLIDRRAFADAVYFGLAEPSHEIVSPGNTFWHVEAAAPGFALDAARRRLSGLHLADRDRDGMLEDADGNPVRFTLLTQQGNTSLERGAYVIRESLAAAGIRVDVLTLEVNALVEYLMSGRYDAAYFRLLTTDSDPALNVDFWRSSGSAHVWNPSQTTPSTEWEAEIDRLIDEIATTLEPNRRRELFGRVQQIIAGEVPVLCFAYPRLMYAINARVADATPAAFRPPLLWNAAVLTTHRRIAARHEVGERETH
jgi:peptide/nickel transport system substrate-binding protein